jgi:signal transduction histidine kinase
MPPEDKESGSERRRTDESLRVEREKTDQTLGEDPVTIDDVADAVISRARSRADELLAAARAKTDRQSAASAPSAQFPKIIERERVLEDQVLREERANADETLRAERAENVGPLSIERAETDKDLFSERARSDDALATLDEFLGIVSHDLGNMLTTIIGFAVIIEKGVARENHAKEALMYAQRIQRSGARMSRLIGDLVDVASIEAGKLAVTREVGDPTQVVAEAVDTLQAQALASGVSLMTEIVPPSSLARFDTARILQVLINLLSNAIKFTPENGKVVVHVERIGYEICFAVSDTGTGIPTDKLEAVFERFLQVTMSDRRGFGLGLYISKSIVQAHGGRIWAESRIGEGSTFCFTLPVHVAREDEQSAADRLQRESSASSGGTDPGRRRSAVGRCRGSDGVQPFPLFRYGRSSFMSRRFTTRT